MKKIPKRITKITAATLAGTISLLGFGSCKTSKTKTVEASGPAKPEMIDQIMLMYGVPPAAWRLSGQVVDEDNKPVENAIVSIEQGSEEDGFTTDDVITTGKSGLFVSKSTPIPGQQVRIVVTPPNDNLLPDTLTLSSEELSNTPDKRVVVRLKRK